MENEREAINAAIKKLAHLKAEVERYKIALSDVPKQVPTNWLDPLLSGLDAVSLRGSDCREIEALLRGIQDRQRKFVKEVLASEGGEKDDER